MGAIKNLLLVLHELEDYAAHDVWEEAMKPEGARRRVFVDTGGHVIGEALYEDDQIVAARWLLDPAALRNCY